MLGQGYVGLVLAMRATEAGFIVTGVETDERRAAALAAGRSYVEDVPDDVLQAALARGYVATGDAGAISGADVAVISVPTPLTEGAPDLSYIESAATAVGRALGPGSLVILESTTYPGTTEEVVAPSLEHASGAELKIGENLLLGYSPERIDPGNQRHTLANTPKVVSGIDEVSLHAVELFYSSFVEKVVPVSSTGVAELCKLIENTFRHVNIAFINEMAIFAAALDVDVWEAIDAAATKPFGYMAFRPGPGVGGHCLPIDPTYLSWRVRHRLGETFRFVELANDINDHMPAYVVRRVQDRLNRDGLALKGARLLVMGLAYKKDTSDARESPTFQIIRQLQALGAEVEAVDPYVQPLTLPSDDPVAHSRDLDEAAVRRADVVLILTDHDAFDYDLVVRHARRILDTRNRLQNVRSPNIERL